MSEYQYFEFQTVDRPLTQREMNELRRYSSRAEITPTSFVNEYQWGDFKGNENLWMEEYFDGFLHYTNWGTHCLSLRIPAIYLDLETAQDYCDNDLFSVRLKYEHLIFDFDIQFGESEEWEESLKLSTFLSLRTDIILGDLRCLYLGWLSTFHNDEFDEELLEPPVPPGLKTLNPALSELAEFLCLDYDLLEAAAQSSAPLEDSSPDATDLKKWILSLSPTERDTMLTEILRQAMENNHSQSLYYIHRFRQTRTIQTPERRTIGELLTQAKQVEQKRIEIENEKAALKLAAQKLAREKFLDGLLGREETIWNQIEWHISEKKAKNYDHAIHLLIDLRDLSVREKSTGFFDRVQTLKRRHSTKSSFIERLKSFQNTL